MERNTVIRVSDVSKSFKVFFDKSASLKEKLLFSDRRRFEEREVLKGISFETRKGEAVGIIGENGCGKSTLLKLLSRIMYPDTGSIEIEGRVSALIELAAGFHPDMSGRENIYINAAIFGLSKKEIDSRIDEIIEFSELEKYIDNPVRTYSSGMYMRLAFSVAINVDADVLLVDEILAVGDAAFQAKCFNKMREIKAKGTTIVIVSHALGQIEQFCDRSIWLCDGVIRRVGKPREVHQAYLDYMGGKYKAKQSPEPARTAPAAPEEAAAQSSEASSGETKNDASRWGSGAARITKLAAYDAEGREALSFKTGESMSIVMEYAASPGIDDAVCGFGIFRNDGLHCYGTNTFVDGLAEIKLLPTGKVGFNIDKLMLLPGEYNIDAAIHRRDGFAYDYWRNVIKFNVYSNMSDIGVLRLAHTWSIDADN